MASYSYNVHNHNHNHNQSRQSSAKPQRLTNVEEMQIQLGIKFYAHVENCGLAYSGQGTVKYDHKLIYVCFRVGMYARVKTDAYAMIPQAPVWSSRSTIPFIARSLSTALTPSSIQTTYVHKNGHADGGGSGEN